MTLISIFIFALSFCWSFCFFWTVWTSSSTVDGVLFVWLFWSTTTSLFFWASSFIAADKGFSMVSLSSSSAAAAVGVAFNSVSGSEELWSTGSSLFSVWGCALSGVSVSSSTRLSRLLLRLLVFAHFWYHFKKFLWPEAISALVIASLL